MNTAFVPSIYREMFILPEDQPMKFLLMGGIVVVGIQVSSAGESEALSFHLWQSWRETQFWQFNLPSSVNPLTAGEVPSLKKKTKDIILRR